jgi:hypothetical protein
MSGIPRGRLRRGLASLVSVAMIAFSALFLSASLASANAESATAVANVGKGACSTNSAGGAGYYTSCHGNGGSPENWCADFAKWVWMEAGADVSGLSPAAGSFGYYGSGLHSTPHVGDAVLFDYNGAGYADHVAVVTSINSNGTITSIGGNERNGNPAYSTVASDTYSPGTGYSSYWGMTISGYVSPVGGSGYTELVNYASGQKYCLDANLGSGKLYNGDKVQTWACNGGANQKWRWNGSAFQNADTSNGTYCLDAVAGSIGDGDQVQVWSCNGWSNQNWYSTTNLNSPDGWRALSNGANRGMCLDASFATGSLFNGDKVELWGCNNGGNQAWTVP